MNHSGILKNKLFLYLTEFFAGMSVMAVELGASRLLAPYFSSSQIVWTIVIGTIMIAMALGNIYGGKSADKSPNPDKLYSRILIAAIWIALIPVVGKYIILGISALLIFTVSNNYLQVSETDRQVVLSTNVLFGVQSLYMKEGGLTGMYYDYAMAAPLMVPDKPVEDMNVLILGMGTGTYATQCRKYFGDMNIEGVEIDEKITELSREYFSLPEDVKVTTYDGRAFLQAVETTYDVIMVDAYQDITIPFQMSSVEFFTMVKDHLKDGGVMVVNMNMHGNKEGDINQYLADTIANVFDNVYSVDVAGSTNRELFASQHSDMIEVLSDHVENLSDAGLQNMMRRVADNSVAYAAGDYLMTDDKAPVELLGMQVIDQLIQEEVAYYKDIYEEQGISGLLEHL